MPPSLASRLLFHSSPPPLLFPAVPDLSDEIYDLIALALRAYVSPWYSKISRYDKDFLSHLSTVLTSVIINLHTRVSSPSAYADIPSLVLIDLPVILAQHYRDFRSARDRLGSAYANGGAASLRTLFARVQPHTAFGDDAVINIEYYRQVVDHILRLLLPPDDYAPDAERIILIEVILNVFLNDIIPRISHPAFIYNLLLDLVGSDDGDNSQLTKHELPSSSTFSFSFHNLIVGVLSALQAFSTLCLTLIHHYKHTVSTIKLLQSQHPSPYPPKHYAHPPLALISEILSVQTSFFLTFSLTSLSMLASLFSIPIFSSSPPILPLLLPHILLTTLSSPSFLLSTTRTLKNSLFPNGYPGPPPPEPTPEQVSLLRTKLINNICRNNHRKLPRFLLGPNCRKTVEEALDPLADEECNKRLVVFLLDRVLVGLFPELVGGQSQS
jgi:hypothetical protein